MSDESHSFNIENIHSLENLNDLHLNQLNNQLRYELRNLNADVDVDVGVDVDVDVDFTNHVDVTDVDDTRNRTLNGNDHTLNAKNNRLLFVNDTNNNDEQDNEQDNEPFKNYINSIVSRSTHNHNLNLDDTNNKHMHNDDINSVTVDVGEVERHFNEFNPSTLTTSRRLLNQQLDIDNIVKQYDAEEGRRLKKLKFDNRILKSNLDNVSNILLGHDSSNTRYIHNNNNNNSNNNNNNNNGGGSVIDSCVGNNGANNTLLSNRFCDIKPIQQKLKLQYSNRQDQLSLIDSQIISDVKKCSRCRMKRIHENESDLEKYQTCIQCRERRKVKEKKPKPKFKLPKLSDNWKDFIEKVALNNVIDLTNHTYKAYSNEKQFTRYRADELTLQLIQFIGDKIVETYIHPLQEITGFKFAIRDHHNPTLYDFDRIKKITWTFICSQDKLRRRKSRSENKRQILNKLKTEECCSKIKLSYDLVHGIIQINYNHKHHNPLKPVDLNIINGIKLDKYHNNQINLNNVNNSETDDIGNSSEFIDTNKSNSLTNNYGKMDMNLHLNLAMNMKNDDNSSDERESKTDYATREVVEAAKAAVAAAVASSQLGGDEPGIENKDTDVGHGEDQDEDEDEVENKNGIKSKDNLEGVIEIHDHEQVKHKNDPGNTLESRHDDKGETGIDSNEYDHHKNKHRNIHEVEYSADKSRVLDESNETFDNEQFNNIMIGAGNRDGDISDDVNVEMAADVDIDVDVDVDDVEEIAKLLKQVQQAQNRRLGRE